MHEIWYDVHSEELQIAKQIQHIDIGCDKKTLELTILE